MPFTGPRNTAPTLPTRQLGREQKGCDPTKVELKLKRIKVKLLVRQLSQQQSIANAHSPQFKQKVAVAARVQ